MILAKMQKTINLFGVVIIAAGLVVMSGCDQSQSVTIHEPGVYQGADDDLKTDQAQLRERIKSQMDR